MITKLLLTSILISYIHPVHISVTNIEFYENKKYFEISIRLFIDDFEAALSYHSNQTIPIQNSKKYPVKIINDYISENLKIKINDTWINKDKYKLQKIEKKDITIWLYYRIPFKEEIKEISIQNTLIFNLYHDQKNMLIFSKNNQSTYDFTTTTPTQKIIL